MPPAEARFIPVPIQLKLPLTPSSRNIRGRFMKLTTLVASLLLSAFSVVDPALAASTGASMKEADALQAKAGQEAGRPAYSPGKGVTFNASDHVYIRSALAVDFSYARRP